MRSSIVQVRNQMFEKSLVAKIIRVASALEREVESELKVSYALTFSQFKVLSTLKSLGEVSQKDVAAALEVTPAVITRQAEVLSARGLLNQKPNPLSKRENQLVLTKKGEGAVADASKLVSEIMARVMEDVSLQDETALQRGIDGMVKRFA
jgi:DNA-binding MarR family transcriptional regulator